MAEKRTKARTTSLTVVDETGVALRAATKIVLKPVRGGDGPYAGSSKGGTAVTYLLDVPSGEYELTITSRNRLEHRSRITVDKQGRKLTVRLERPGDPEHGDAVERAHGWFSDIRAYPAKRIPPNARRDALDRKRRLPKPPPPRPPRSRWTALGPRNISGRVRALAAHPTDGETIFAGSANAGVWVTNNGGETWRSLWFDEPVLEIGALAIHLTVQSEPDGDVTLYAGTGTTEFGGPTLFPAYPGAGIFKSTQSGAPGSWTQIPIPLSDVNALVVDPNSLSSNPDTVVLYAAGSGGLYESNDAGLTWTQVMSGNIRSIALDPLDPLGLYAGVAGAGVRRLNRDTLQEIDWNINVAGPHPTSMMVAIGQTEPFTMYAKYDSLVYRYNREANEWKNLGDHGGSTYGYWNECLGVDPNDSAIVLSGGVSLEWSADAGESWTPVSLDSDHHAVAFSSQDSSTVYVGNDHGVRKGLHSNPGVVGTWAKVHNGLMLTHYNGLGASSVGPNVVGGGTQDNGTHRTVGGLTWANLRGGDGGGFLYDPDDAYTMYYTESYALSDPNNGDVFVTTDGGATTATANTSNFQGPFVTPLAIDPDSSPSNRILFAGGVNRVLRSGDGGMTWSISSPDMNAEVRSLSVSPRTSAVMYAGTHDGNVWRSTDGGSTVGNWKQITPGGGAVVPGRRLTSVLADPQETFGVYVTFGGLTSATPNSPGHLFHGVSTDGGSSYVWSDRTGDLPDIPCYSVAIDPGDPKRLWIGTDIGVFESQDAASTWFDDDGLPNVVVTELQVRDGGDVIRAATYGWGMWQRRIQAPSHPIDVYVRNNKLDTGETSPSPTHVVDPEKVGAQVYFWESPDIKASWGQPPVDGVQFDELKPDAPAAGAVNPLYVQVHNRGWKPAASVFVKAIWTKGGAALPPLPADLWSSFPDNWSSASDWKPVDPNLPFQVVPVLQPHTPAIVSWSWKLPLNAPLDCCVLMVASASQDPVVRSDAKPDDLVVDTVSLLDKHVAHRNIQIVTFPFAAQGVAATGPQEIFIDLNNPYTHPDHFHVEIDRGTLPAKATVDVVLPSTGPRADSRRVLIPARSRVRARITLALPATSKPGDEYRFSVIQRRRGRVIGGGTYDVRVPPVSVRISPARAR